MGCCCICPTELLSVCSFIRHCEGAQLQTRPSGQGSPLLPGTSAAHCWLRSGVLGHTVKGGVAQLPDHALRERRFLQAEGKLHEGCFPPSPCCWSTPFWNLPSVRSRGAWRVQSGADFLSESVPDSAVVKLKQKSVLKDTAVGCIYISRRRVLFFAVRNWRYRVAFVFSNAKNYYGFMFGCDGCLIFLPLFLYSQKNSPFQFWLFLKRICLRFFQACQSSWKSGSIFCVYHIIWTWKKFPWLEFIFSGFCLISPLSLPFFFLS